jgi:predicted nucleic acid-binding protein
MTTFVDTNVVVDALDPRAARHHWAKEALAKADQPLVVCDIVFSEFSVSLASVEDTNEAIKKLALERYPFSDGALFLAGKAFAEYKRRGGQKTNVLSDFLIGAQACDESVALVTANERDFRCYFPQQLAFTKACGVTASGNPKAARGSRRRTRRATRGHRSRRR